MIDDELRASGSVKVPGRHFCVIGGQHIQHTYSTVHDILYNTTISTTGSQNGAKLMHMVDVWMIYWAATNHPMGRRDRQGTQHHPFMR